MIELTLEHLNALLESAEGEILEFKEAKRNFAFDKLAKYCVALANEGGGKMVLGVTDRRPRKIVGSEAFPQPEQTRNSLIQQLHINIDFSIVYHPNGRVLVFHVPTHPVGNPIKIEGIYWARKADSLVAMDEDRLRMILTEAGSDFSASICPGAGMMDLDSSSIEDFRHRWITKSGNQSLKTLSNSQLLTDAEVIVDGKLTYAALILFGTRNALGKYLAQSEVIFEYRSTDASGPAQQRKEYRQGFFSFYNDLWSTINLRNDIQHFQAGLFVLDIPTFNERVVREVILNAVSHRDYQLAGSVYIRQFPRLLKVESPGGFPPGITEDNILDRQIPRNRRIADIFCKCGLVERSGQGMNLMFELNIRDSKPIPDFTGTDQYQVVLNLSGEVQNPRFLQFLEKIGRETSDLFSTTDFLILDHVHREHKVPDTLKNRLDSLIKKGIIERFGRGRGAKLILSRRYYSWAKENGAYTRKKGLDRETNKALLMKHINDHSQTGSRLKDLMEVLPALSMPQVQSLLRELKEEGKIFNVGRTRSALWHPGSNANPITSDKNS
jgi:ATP-dependent DNA helicase RecG